MHKRKIVVLALALMWCWSVQAQQQAPQPLTFWYAYTVNAGKEDEFMNLVKTIGAPVRDKLMAEGVVLAWGIEAPLLRKPGDHTHLIWYSVMDWSGVEKVQMAMQAKLAQMAADDAKAAEEARKKGQKAGMTTAERTREVIDASKTRDYVTRDLVSGEGSAAPPAGLLPWVRYTFAKAKPGKAGDFRSAWEKYNKPVYDKLVADGTILAYGFAAEEVRTEGNFTHFTWYAVKSAEAFDKVRSAFAADRNRRSQEEREAIGELFNGLTDADASRSMVTRSIIFKVAGQK